MRNLNFLICLLMALMLSFCVYGKEPKKEITIAVGALGKEYKVTKMQAKDFMKENHDVKVNVIQIPSSTDEKLAYYLQQIEVKSGSVDIFSIDIAWIGDIQKSLVDLKKYELNKLVDQMFPIGAKVGYIDDRLVAIPWFSDTALMYYRSDLLKKYNVEVPKTWVELTKAAYKIQTAERAAGEKKIL